MKVNIQDRLGKAREELKDKKADALIVTTAENVRYLSGFTGDDSWLVLTPRAAYLLTDSRYTEQAQNQCIDCRIVERKVSLSQQAAKILGRLKKVKSVGIEGKASLAVFNALKKSVKGVKIVSGVIESLRVIKDKDEVAAIRKAAQIAAAALRKIVRFAKTGVSENELAGRLDFEMRRLGAVNSFPTIVAFSANASRPHHQPTDKRLKENDTVLIDFGAKYDGYCCDITRCFSVGKRTRFYSKIYDAVEMAQRAGIEKVRAGVTAADVDAAARKVLKDAGLPLYGHGTGHGLGLEVHESPIVSAKNGDKELKAGMVVTIEPGVYIPGKTGVRIEDDVLVTETGGEILTACCPYEVS
ncbi:MAG: Xaa-Pro peptidase family protein [Phycisphaerae bacterium]|nr:Xaa-Pro peptidase family protein [Phycisphaerae bacterium]